MTDADRAVEHILQRMVSDPKLAYLLGFGTESFHLLTIAYASAKGLDLEEVQKQWWGKINEFET